MNIFRYSKAKAERIINLFSSLYHKELQGDWPCNSKTKQNNNNEKKDNDINEKDVILDDLLNDYESRSISKEEIFQCENDYIHECEILGIKPCSLYLSNMFEQVINLSHYGLNDIDLQPIINIFKKSSITKVFSLSDNHITSIGASYIKDLLLLKECKIGILDLSSNKIEDDGTTSICEGLLNNTLLKRLCLRVLNLIIIG